MSQAGEFERSQFALRTGPDEAVHSLNTSADATLWLMGHIRIRQQINASRESTWRHLSDLASHPTWMKDAVSIEFVTKTDSGVGTTMRVPTKVGPFRTTDVIEVVSWHAGESIGVEHRGIVSGVGEFRLSGDDRLSTIVWEEELTFPWWWGGRITAWWARPVLRWIWKGNLRRFAQIVTD